MAKSIPNQANIKDLYDELSLLENAKQKLTDGDLISSWLSQQLLMREKLALLEIIRQKEIEEIGKILDDEIDKIKQLIKEYKE